VARIEGAVRRNRSSSKSKNEQLTHEYTLCMVVCMRTNTVIDDALLSEAMEHSHSRTKRGLIEEVLHTFIRVKVAEKNRKTMCAV